jgi:YHS domain-containing protein
MTTINDFRERLNMEFGLMPAALDERRGVLEREYHERQRRVAELFLPALAQLRSIWEPRRDALLDRFKDAIHIMPAANDEFGTASFSLDSPLARVTLRFTFSHDPEVQYINLEYHLDVVPILMKIDNHSTLDMQLENFDQEMAALWLEDRMVSFIRTVVELNGNQYYLKDHMVEDTIAHVRVPQSMASETVEWDGHKYYFICADTRREFETRHGCTNGPSKPTSRTGAIGGEHE